MLLRQNRARSRAMHPWTRWVLQLGLVRVYIWLKFLRRDWQASWIGTAYGLYLVKDVTDKAEKRLNFVACLQISFYFGMVTKFAIHFVVNNHVFMVSPFEVSYV